jgi:SAM-dependent methyltransferase
MLLRFCYVAFCSILRLFVRRGDDRARLLIARRAQRSTVARMAQTDRRLIRGAGLTVVGMAVLTGAMFWLRRHPSACPYALHLSLEPPHPLITRPRLQEILSPQPGERILEIGPGTGFYTLPIARWIGPHGRLDILDVQQAMLDNTMRRARESSLENIVPACADAQRLPYADAAFDAVVLITTLGEIPDQDASWREIARVLKPAGRAINGELFFGDPHWVTPRTAERRADAAGLTGHKRIGPAIGYFARHHRT